MEPIIVKKEAAKAKTEELEYANEILITKTELEEKNRLVFNLQQQVDETRTESEYQLRLKDNKFSNHKRFCVEKL